MWHQSLHLSHCRDLDELSTTALHTVHLEFFCDSGVEHLESVPSSSPAPSSSSVRRKDESESSWTESDPSDSRLERLGRPLVPLDEPRGIGGHEGGPSGGAGATYGLWDSGAGQPRARYLGPRGGQRPPGGSAGRSWRPLLLLGCVCGGGGGEEACFFVSGQTVYIFFKNSGSNSFFISFTPAAVQAHAGG